MNPFILSLCHMVIWHRYSLWRYLNVGCRLFSDSCILYILYINQHIQFQRWFHELKIYSLTESVNCLSYYHLGNKEVSITSGTNYDHAKLRILESWCGESLWEAGPKQSVWINSTLSNKINATRACPTAIYINFHP
jgi:hypothetical protein